jgi:hypothetical protein
VLPSGFGGLGGLPDGGFLLLQASDPPALRGFEPDGTARGLFAELAATSEPERLSVGACPAP